MSKIHNVAIDVVNGMTYIGEAINIESYPIQLSKCVTVKCKPVKYQV